MEGMTALLHGDVLSRECIWSLDRGEGCGESCKIRSDTGQAKGELLFLGSFCWDMYQREHRGIWKHQRMLLHSVCGHLAAAKSSLVQQVPGLKVHWGLLNLERLPLALSVTHISAQGWEWALGQQHYMVLLFTKHWLLATSSFTSLLKNLGLNLAEGKERTPECYLCSVY